MSSMDKKIKMNSTDRRSFYAPSGHGRVCPYLKHDDNDEPVLEPDLTNPYTKRKPQRAVCTEVAPVCSYHLGDYNNHIEYVLDEFGEKLQDTDPDGNPLFDEKGLPVYRIASQRRVYFCHRYLHWKESGVPKLVDTHGTKLQSKGRTLGWF